jgi:hypothetical protein
MFISLKVGKYNAYRAQYKIKYSFCPLFGKKRKQANAGYFFP